MNTQPDQTAAEIRTEIVLELANLKDYQEIMKKSVSNPVLMRSMIVLNRKALRQISMLVAVLDGDSALESQEIRNLE